MRFRHTPKFHVLFEHVPETLHKINRFFDMGEDAIECWHQTRTRHDARTRSLRSKERQKLNIAKHEHVSNDAKINNIVSDVNEKQRDTLKPESIMPLKIEIQKGKK